MESIESQLATLRKNEVVVQVAAQLVAKASTMSMAKNSQAIVDQVEVEILKALASKRINETHIIAVIRAGKTFSLTSVNDLKRVLEENLAKGVKEKEQYANSASHLKYRSLVEKVSEFIAATPSMEVDFRKLGTLVRTKVFMDATKSIRTGMSTLMFPAGRELIMGDAIWNQMNFAEALNIISVRLVITSKFLAYIEPFCMTVAAGTTSPEGFFVKSAHLKLKESKTPNSWSKEVDPPTYGEDTRTLESFNGTAVNDENAILFLAAAFPVDVRMLMQTSSYKQAKAKPAELRKLQVIVGSNALAVIRMVDPGYTIIGKSINLDHKGEFMQHYFKCHAVIKTTIRTMNRDIYGKKGGADTRSKYNKEAVAITEKETVGLKGFKF
jgi:hypothetical protein